MSLIKSNLIRISGILLIIILMASLIIPAVQVPAAEPEETLNTPQLKLEGDQELDVKGEESFDPFQREAEFPVIENKLLPAGDRSIQTGEIGNLEDNNTPVLFPDPGLEAAIRKALDQPTGDIYQEDMLHILVLNADDRGITNLSGIEYCTNTITISLVFNELTDISPLSSLVNLRTLLLFANQIIDVSPLETLTNLEHLYLDDNHIVDVSSLAGLKKLSSLGLFANDIIEISPLDNLTSLEYLDITSNKIVDITPLSFMGKITRLQMGCNQIADITAMADLINLEYIDLQANQVSDISPLTGLSNLESLCLAFNLITCIPEMTNMSALKYLELSDNQIESISNLSSCTNLESLNLSNNKIDNETAIQSVLSAMPHLGTLSLAGCGITDLSTLISSLPVAVNLVHLGLSDNQIGDISHLSGLVNLQTLHIWGNQIKSISDLSTLTNLSLLDLCSNNVSNISALAGLNNLKSLYLSNNLISDISPLLNNPGLGSGDVVELKNNYLDLTAGSQDMADIQALINRGANVVYSPQKKLPTGLYIEGDLPDGDLKVTYPVQILTARNGTGPFTWSLKEGDKLPPGLKLNAPYVNTTPTPVPTSTTKTPTSTTWVSNTTRTSTTTTITITTTSTTKPASTSTAKISGKPTKAGTYTFSVKVKDSSVPQVTASMQFTVIIYPALSITTPATIKAEVGVSMDYAPTAQGGNGHYVWSVSGWDKAPPWLEFETFPHQGNLSGTPTVGTAGKSYRFTLIATDSLGGTASKKITVKVLKAMVITTESLPDAEIGVKYKSTTLKAQGGTGSYTWDIVDGSLPEGMYLEKGVIKGTPETGITSLNRPNNGGGGGGSGGEGYEVTITVRVDDGLAEVTKALSFTLYDRLEIDKLSEGVVGWSYSHTLSASGGKGPYKFTLTGKLPKGLKYNSKTAAIYGMPEVDGTYPIKVKVTDPLKGTQTRTLDINIVKPVTIVFSSSDEKGGAWSEIYDPFFSEVIRRTNGTVRFEQHWGGELSGFFEAYDNTANGYVDMAQVMTSMYPNLFPLEDITSMVDYEVNNLAVTQSLNELASKFPQMEQAYEQSGTKLLWRACTFPNKSCMINGKAIRSFANFKGKKYLTTSPWDAATWKALGMVPVSMMPTEIFLNLQTGVIDGATLTIANMFDFGLGEVIPYVTDTNLRCGSFQVVMNLNTWNKLSPYQQQIIQEEAAKIAVAQDEQQLRFDRVLRSTATLKWDTEFIELSADDFTSMNQATEPVKNNFKNDLDAKGLPGTSLLDEWLELQTKYAGSEYALK